MEWWQAAIGTAIGGVLVIVGGVVTTLLQHRDATADRQHQRQTALDDQQRAWILALQDGLLTAVAAARRHYSDQIAFDERTGQGFEPELTEDFAFKERDQWDRIAALTGRLRDTELRESSVQIVDEVEKALRAVNASDAWDRLVAASDALARFNARAGVVIDKL